MHAMYMMTIGTLYTVEPPNKGHFGSRGFVLCSEVVPISEVHYFSSTKLFYNAYYSVQVIMVMKEVSLLSKETVCCVD